MAKYKFTNIPLIYAKASSFASIKSTCGYLDQLNQVLRQSIPEQYATFCHFGAIDEDRNIAILFISEQKIFHILRTMSEHILRQLSNNNLNFDAILFKHSKNKPSLDISIRYKKLSSIEKEKLLKLANYIGKPELIRDATDLPIKNIDFEVDI